MTDGELKQKLSGCLAELGYRFRELEQTHGYYLKEHDPSRKAATKSVLLGQKDELLALIEKLEAFLKESVQRHGHSLFGEGLKLMQEAKTRITDLEHFH